MFKIKIIIGALLTGFLFSSLAFFGLYEALAGHLAAYEGEIRLSLAPHSSTINQGASVNLTLTMDNVTFPDHIPVNINGCILKDDSTGATIWSNNTISSGNSFTISVSPNSTRNYTAQCEGGMDDSIFISGSDNVSHTVEVTVLPLYLLSVTKSGSGTGIATSAPAGINCGNDCSESYASGTNVVLTAQAASGSTFAGWSGTCSGIGSCAITMNANKSATATFNLTTAFLPTLSFAVNPSTIKQGESSTLSWSSQNVNSCLASDGWSGAKPLSGSEIVSPKRTTDYTLTCFGAGGQVSKSATVVIKAIPGVIEF